MFPDEEKRKKDQKSTLNGKVSQTKPNPPEELLNSN